MSSEDASVWLQDLFQVATEITYSTVVHPGLDWTSGGDYRGGRRAKYY